jgi:hypothetical protein
MAVEIASNTQSEAELTEALVANGYTVVEGEKEEEAKPAEEVDKSEPAGEPGEKIPAETEGKTAAEAEPAKDKSQETSQEDKDKAETKKSKGGFQAKVEKLTQRLDEAREELELERGDKTKLRQKVEELEAKLAGITAPAETAKPAELVKPKRPEMPDPSDVDFDPEKYSALRKKYAEDMAKYDDEMETYREALTDKKVREAREADQADYRERERKRQENEAMMQFALRKEKDEGFYEDFKEMTNSLSEEQDNNTVMGKSPQAYFFIMNKAQHPADLLYYFAKDMAENDGEENDRIKAMDPFDQIIELKALGDRLAAEREAAVAAKATPPKGETKTAAAAEPEKKAPPAKERPRVETPDAPISPVGARANAKGKTLDEQMRDAAEAGNNKEFNRLLALQHKERASARA